MGKNSSQWTKFDSLTIIIFEFTSLSIVRSLGIINFVNTNVTLVTPRIKKSLDSVSSFNVITKNLKNLAKYE